MKPLGDSKLDGVGQLITETPLTIFTTLCQKIPKKVRKKWYVTCDTWYVTCDMWYRTHDMWRMTEGGRWPFSLNFSSLALMVWEWRYFKDIALHCILKSTYRKMDLYLVIIHNLILGYILYTLYQCCLIGSLTMLL